MRSLLAGRVLNVNNVWNAIILEAVVGNGQFLNLQVAYPKSRTELCFVVTLWYTAESRVPARQVYGGCTSFRSTLSSK